VLSEEKAGILYDALCGELDEDAMRADEESGYVLTPQEIERLQIEKELIFRDVEEQEIEDALQEQEAEVLSEEESPVHLQEVEEKVRSKD
jgi:hypothetical protein